MRFWLWSHGFRAIADELAGSLFAQGTPADLVSCYARQLPLWVICELLGRPLADRPKFITWAGRATGITSFLGLLRVAPTLAAMKRYVERHLEQVRKIGGADCRARPRREGGCAAHS